MSKTKATRIGKTDLIAQIADMSGIPKTQVEMVYNSFVDSLIVNLKGDNEIVLTGFGTFKKSHRAARKGRNPQTGEVIDIAASTTVTFKPGKALKDGVK